MSEVYVCIPVSRLLCLILLYKYTNITSIIMHHILVNLTLFSISAISIAFNTATV